jgi:hypothetical protein
VSQKFDHTAGHTRQALHPHGEGRHQAKSNLPVPVDIHTYDGHHFEPTIPVQLLIEYQASIINATYRRKMAQVNSTLES